MGLRIQLITVVLIAALTAGWLSPCCCQSAWLTEQAAGLFASPDDADSCCCDNEMDGRDTPRDCCPVNPGKCKQNGGKTATLKAGPDATPVPVMTFVVEILNVGFGGGQAALRTGAGREQIPPPGLSLLRLHCALVI